MADSVVYRGLASVAGIPGAFDALLYAVKQTGKMTQNWELEEVKDVYGNDAAWLFRNENATGDFMLKLVGDTVAHSLVPATVVAYDAGTAGAAISGLLQPFLGAGSVINLSGFAMTAMNGIFQVMAGSDVDMSNVKVGEISIKLRKYALAAQNTAMATVPA